MWKSISSSSSKGRQPGKLSPPNHHHSYPPCIANNFSNVVFSQVSWFPLKLCILPLTVSLFYCRPEVWARREAEKIVAARDAAYAEAVAKGEPVDEGEDIGDFKPSDMKRIL